MRQLDGQRSYHSKIWHKCTSMIFFQQLKGTYEQNGSKQSRTTITVFRYVEGEQ
jgi:hypothetical protein